MFSRFFIDRPIFAAVLSIFIILAGLASLVAQDWTAGCIAVTTDADIEAVAAWVRKVQVKEVRLAL